MGEFRLPIDEPTIETWELSWNHTERGLTGVVEMNSTVNIPSLHEIARIARDVELVVRAVRFVGAWWFSVAHEGLPTKGQAMDPLHGAGRPATRRSKYDRNGSPFAYRSAMNF